MTNLKPNPGLARLPIFDRKGWKRLQFGTFADSINERVEPADAADEIYVGLDHLDSDSLHIRRWGKGSDVIGTKLRFRKEDIIFGRRRAYQRKLAVALTLADTSLTVSLTLMDCPVFLLHDAQSGIMYQYDPYNSPSVHVHRLPVCFDS